MGPFLKISGIREYVAETLKIIYFYRGRVVFSLAGVALGILSICTIITTIEGANKKAYEILEALGPDSIMIFSGGERQSSARTRGETLTLNDADALSRIGGIYDTLKSRGVGDVLIRYRERKWNTMVVGATENYFTAMTWKLAVGSPFNGSDNEKAEPVAVIGSKVYDEIFKGENAVGRAILVGKLPVTVLGVLEERGGGFGGARIDDRIIMPLNTVMGRVTNERKYLRSIRLKTTRDVDETIEDVRAVLRRNHGIKHGEDDFTIRSSKDVLKYLMVISGGPVILLGVASIIALIVSGFVLANLFFISIQERRKDIGIRRAYGATRKGIINSFLLESVMITTMGGIAGILLSILLAGTFEKLFDIPMVFSYRVVVAAFVFSLATGILAGLKPALTASRIEPIEAIRG